MLAEQLERRVPIAPGSFDAETRSFDAVIPASAPVERQDFVSVFIETLAPVQALTQNVSLLDNRNARSANPILGRVSSIRVDGGAVIATIKLGSRPDAQALGRGIRDGIVDSVFIGYEVQRWRAKTVDGRRHKTAVAWRLREVSFAPAPEDQGATITNGIMPEEIRKQERPKGERPAMPIITSDLITRAGIQAHPERLYVFGDNFQQTGRGGQAKECRGEPNAVGIPTKRAPRRTPEAYLTNADLGEWRARSEGAFRRISGALDEGREVVMPLAGVGTGLAQLQERAPLMWQALQATLSSLGHFDRNRAAAETAPKL